MAIFNRLGVVYFVGWLVGFIPSAGLFGQEFGPPEGYYDPAEGLVGDALKTSLHDIIDGHIVASYGNIALAFQEYDKDPANENNILLLYSGASVSKFHQNYTNWNREHSWPQSFGADNGPANSDAHHLFPANPQTNSDRLNYAFDELESSRPLVNAPDSKVSPGLRLVEPRDEDKGRIARAMLYMETRYDDSNITGDFQLSDDPKSFSNTMGKLTTLLKWNREFPPDERERRRNHLIYAGVRVENSVIFQLNRNPFIDYPELADAAYTGDQYVSWSSWRVEHFKLPELDDEVLTGSSQDPDLDRLTNLMEFALQTDPNITTTDNLPSVDRGEGTNYFVFNRIKEPELSNLVYRVEFSTTPLEGASWQDIPFNTQELRFADRGLYDIASLGHSPEDTSRPAYYRLIAERAPVSSDPVETVFDSALHESGELNLFTYTEELSEGWHLSDWFGFLKPADAPWFYHFEHKWLYTSAVSEEAAWLYDTSLGWIFTGISTYPYIYSSTKGWLYYIKDSQSPNRWFYMPTTGLFILEPDLLSN